MLNMVSSVDGKAATEGKAFALGSDVDRTVMRTLRSKADAVMVGAGTLRAEKLSLGVEDSSVPQPLAVIATSTADLPLENLIKSASQELLVVTAQDAPAEIGDQLAQFSERASVLRVSKTRSGAPDLLEALESLAADHGVQSLLVEGGPSINHALISSNLADELFLTLAPILLAGASRDALNILDGPSLRAVNMDLLSLHAAANELFLRYALHYY